MVLFLIPPALVALGTEAGLGIAVCLFALPTHGGPTPGGGREGRVRDWLGYFGPGAGNKQQLPTINYLRHGGVSWCGSLSRPRWWHGRTVAGLEIACLLVGFCLHAADPPPVGGGRAVCPIGGST